MATYDVLSIYPEGKACEACGNKIKNNFFITITGRTVCSYKCKNNLKSKPEDSCCICGKPVWEGNCYATRTKYICSDKCKDAFLKQREQNLIKLLENKQNSYIREFQKMVQDTTASKESKEYENKSFIFNRSTRNDARFQ